ncbi:MAG: PSP1 domain-containing protein [Bacteroidota bacterium]
MDELMHRGCCEKDCRENPNENSDRITSYFSKCSKLDDYDWLRDLPETAGENDIVEVRFKNTRKGFYRNVNQLRLNRGDIVAVEASPGHDIGVVSLTGNLVVSQLYKYGIKADSEEIKKVYRKAKEADLAKWKEAIKKEHETMIRSRSFADRLKLDMKIGDVEFQGDETKAIFYYIADERVDFRQLIKDLAEAFRVRIEMKQIGARQEAGRIGGIGSCGRELCCATWITNFVSVTTIAARYQEVSLNPQKLAGQCGKLKCCLNYEVSSYVDAQKDFPDRNILLKTLQGEAYFQKTDIYRGIYWYSFDKGSTTNLIPVPVERVKEIIRLNNKNVLPEHLMDIEELTDDNKDDYADVIGQESLTRFENKKRSRKKKSRKKKKKKNPPSNEA